jgi:hypothetical protein
MEVANMKIIKASLVVSALAVLAGCVAVPVGPGYNAGPPGYYAPGYYAPPAYYGPSVSIGVFGGERFHGHR